MTKVNMRDRPHPGSIIERSRMQRGNIGTGSFFASDPAAAISAKPVRAFGSAGTDLTPKFWRAAGHREAFGFDQHCQAESAT
jgi:hypothetical protein